MRDIRGSSIVRIAVAATAALVTGFAVPAVAAASAPTGSTGGPGPRPAAPRHTGLAPAHWGAAGFGRWLPAAPLGGGLAPLSGTGLRTAAGASWRVQPTPNAAMPNGTLTAVSCTGSGPSSCTAVGGYENSSGTGLTLAERRADGTWAVQATPDPAAAVWSGLTGVSCPTATDCAAVGWYLTAAGQERSLAQRWDGRRWTVQPVPSPAGATNTGLFAVSCTTASVCTAVGEYVTARGIPVALAARWNGSSWVLAPVPAPSGSLGTELSAVSCVAGTCLAAGATATASTQLTLAERWDGTAWHVTATPNPSGAQGSGLSAISCASALSCEAVGSYGALTADGAPAALTEAWNGTAWTLQVVPVPPPGPQSLPMSTLGAVSCSSPTACAAVGAYSPGAGQSANLAESWNGASWVIKSTPNPAGNIGTGLSGVSCTAGGGCAAAGTYYVQQPFTAVGGAPIPGMALAESWNGTRWTLQSARDLSGAGEDSELNAIACGAPRACAAVGDYITSKGFYVPLAERWTGHGWIVEPVRNPAANADSFLDGISCPAPAACTAVGFTAKFTGTVGAVALAERWNGIRWVSEPTPLPAHTLGDRLWAVSCPSASACMAVGDYLKAGAPLAEQWNGARWRVLTVPVPGGTSASGLSGVTCTGPRACIAVGYRADSKGNTFALIEAWNGARWRPVAITSSKGTSLAAVSCTAPRACTAVGMVSTYIPGPKGGPGQTITAPFAARSNGTRWTGQTVPDPASGGWLNGVSCSGPRACTAVGGAHTANGATVLLAETWNGARWAYAPASNPGPAFDSLLSGVACSAQRGCTAVGSYLAITNVTVTLAMVS